MVDQAAKLAAAEETLEPPTLTASLFPSPLAEWDPKYSYQEEAWFKTEGGCHLCNGWWEFQDGHIVIPETLALGFVKQFINGPMSVGSP